MYVRAWLSQKVGKTRAAIISGEFSTRCLCSSEKGRGQPVWRYIPAKIQTLICNIVVLHYCSFSHSNIQLLLFNIVHSLFNVHISNATWLRCKMRYAPNAIQHPCFLHAQSMPLFCFQIYSFNMQHSCLSMQF